jgi:hypothetical protein
VVVASAREQDEVERATSMGTFPAGYCVTCAVCNEKLREREEKRREEKRREEKRREEKRRELLIPIIYLLSTYLFSFVGEAFASYETLLCLWKLCR